ncbi:MAG: hypothetical protein M9894_06350 [Planctomycetes bacterium]|nr:hypothetical protein [Planctomycetota bacterium]
MSFLHELATGRHGVRFRPPPGWELAEEGERSALLVDRARGVGWNLGVYDVALCLRPEDDALLAADVERHARALFERCFQSAQESPLALVAPRTQDPAWSPVVELERVEVGAAPALRVVHRLWYQPGRETVMGHLLVPLASGLADLRVIATDHSTGMRESTLFARALMARGGASPDQLMAELGQAHYDDPAHDALFPDHALSRARAALAWLVAEGGVDVRAPAAAEPARTCALAGSFAFEPPARHLPVAAGDGPDAVRCTRATFSGTDGLEVLAVQRLMPHSGSLVAVARAIMAARATEDGSTVVELPPRDGRPRVRASCRDADGDEQHTAAELFVDAAGWCVLVALDAPTCVPLEELFTRVEAVSRSYRVLAP